MKFYHDEPPRYWAFTMNPTDAMLYNMARSISLALTGHELHNSEVSDQQAKDAISLMRSFVSSAREMTGRPAGWIDVDNCELCKKDAIEKHIINAQPIEPESDMERERRG
jgi:hypothetical protein